MGFWRRGNYDFNTPDMILNQIRRFAYFKSGTWYVGITANPVMSLKAHGIDIYKGGFGFDCWDIPFKDAETCKEAILGMEGYKLVTDRESDYVDDTYPNMYVYLYSVRWMTRQRIDPSGFTPLKKMPSPPIVVKYIDRNEKETLVRFDDSFDRAACERLLEDIRIRYMEGQLHGLVVRHRSMQYMELQFGEGCAVISYDSNTSQAGAFQSYRNGSASRKKVKLFTGEYPEYMVCTDADVLAGILRYFLEKGRKPGKRQNVKWVMMPCEKDIRKYK